MKLSEHVRTVRHVLWWVAGVCWLAFVAGCLIASVYDSAAVLVIGQGVIFCTLLTAAAVLAGIVPDTHDIASAAWMAGYRAAAGPAESVTELRSVR